MDFNNDLFLERTFMTSLSFPVISYLSGSPCLVLKPCVNFHDPKRGTWGKSDQICKMLHILR